MYVSSYQREFDTFVFILIMTWLSNPHVLYYYLLFVIKCITTHLKQKEKDDIMCYFFILPGPSLSISGSSSYVVLTQPLTLTCTVSHAAGFSDMVIFSHSIHLISVGTLSQNASSCTVLIPPPESYSVSCGSGTDISSSTTKIYTLKIKRVRVSDVTDWWCELYTARALSKKLNLQYKRKLSS